MSDWKHSLNQFRPLQDQIDMYEAIQRQADMYRIIQDQADIYKSVQAQADMYKAVQRQADMYGSIQASLDLHRTSNLEKLGFTAQAYLDDINRTVEQGRQLYQEDVERIKLALQRAISPLPAFRLENLVGVYGYEDSAFRDAMQRVNSAIASAVYGGGIEVRVREEEEDEDKGDEKKDIEGQTGPLEEQLVKGVSAEVLTQLKRVDFVPINMLDRILRSPEAMRTLSSRDFEHFVATLIEQLGFENVIVTPRSGDHGRDVLATKRVNDISILFAFECKRYKPENPVGPDILRALLGTITHGSTKANKGVLVTTSTFTTGARNYLVTEPALDGKDFDGIIAWLQDYARQSRGKNN